MIESNIIKRFIVKSFMQNSECDISKIAEITFNSLVNRFLLNENVVLPTLELSGKIVKCSKENYVIQMADDSKVEVPFKEIKRKANFDYADIYVFLEAITSVTPFGRIVIENVFEKITQPGFGASQPVFERRSSRQERTRDRNNDRIRNSEMSNRDIGNRDSTEKRMESDLKGLQRRPEKGVRPSVFQSLEIRNQISKSIAKKAEEPEVKIDTNNFKKLVINGFEDKNLSILLRIYTFFTAFKYDLKLGKTIHQTNIKNIGNLLLDPEYSSEIVMDIHRFFIEAIEKDISNSGYRFTNELYLCISKLPDCISEPLKAQKKKRVSFDKDNWKLQVRNFIYNFALELGSDKLLRFLDFSKKESTDLRIEFLDFLFKIFSYTDTFKSLASGAVSTTRMNKAMGRGELEDSSAMNEQQTFILDNPLMANIGRFKNFVLFLSDRKIILGDKFEFYELDQKDANMVLRELNILSKTEKSTITNLRAIIGELYNSKL